MRHNRLAWAVKFNISPDELGEWAIIASQAITMVLRTCWRYGGDNEDLRNPQLWNNRLVIYFALKYTRRQIATRYLNSNIFLFVIWYNVRHLTLLKQYQNLNKFWKLHYIITIAPILVNIIVMAVCATCNFLSQRPF